MSYETVAYVTQTGVLLFFITLFICVLAYALNPSNREKFTRAAHVPLDDENGAPRD